jgi:hypothetical protein
MGKLLAVALVIIALVSAYPIIANKYPLPEDISTHGHQIDEQLKDTMVEAGLSFVGAQLVLALFLWSFTGRKAGSPLKNFPGGARVMVIAAFLIVGSEILALGVLGQKAWATVYFTPPRADALQVQAQAEQLLFISAIPGPTVSLARSIQTKSTKGTRTTSGWTLRMRWKRETTSCRASWSFP